MNNRINSKEELDQMTKILKNTLREIYVEKERDFTFRIRYISKLTGISPHTITNLRSRLPMRECRRSGRGTVYITTFNGRKLVKK